MDLITTLWNELKYLTVIYAIAAIIFYSSWFIWIYFFNYPERFHNIHVFIALFISQLIFTIFYVNNVRYTDRIGYAEDNNVSYKDVIDSNEIAEFSKNDKFVKTTKMERRAHGIDAYFYLVDPATPISAKFYCDKILAERQEFLVKQGRSIACDILGRNSPAEFLTVVYTYGGEEASYTYTNKWCVSFIDE